MEFEFELNLKERRGGYIGGLEAGEKKREMQLKCNLKNNQFWFCFWVFFYFWAGEEVARAMDRCGGWG